MDKTIRHGFTVKPSKDSKVSKNVVLEVNTEGCTEEILLGLAMRDVTIRTQQKLRNAEEFKKLSDGDVIRVNLVDFAPRGSKVDPMTVAGAALSARVKACKNEAEKQAVLKHFLEHSEILPIQA